VLFSTIFSLTAVPCLLPCYTKYKISKRSDDPAHLQANWHVVDYCDKGEKMERRTGTHWIFGLILILVGASMVFGELFSWIRGISFILIVGAVFLVGYIRNRSYGLLIPACLLIAIGITHYISYPAGFDNFGQFMLGIGFVAIYGIDVLVRGKSHWWPIIPGAILLISGYFGSDQVMTIVLPVALILVGISMVVRGWHPRD